MMFLTMSSYYWRISLKSLYQLFVMLAVLPALALSASADVLLVDDFNDNSLNGGLWTVNHGGGSVIETNQRMEFDDWGFLITQQQFNPTDQALTINGTWWSPNNWNVSASDRLKVATRTDAIDTTGNGGLANGILFSTNWDFGSPRLTITEAIGGSHTELAEVAADFGPGDVIDFEIRDDGTLVSLEITPRDPNKVPTLLTATSAHAFSENHVVFYSREDHNGLNTRSYYDDIKISAVPEPSSLLFLPLLASTVLFKRKRRQTTA